MYTIEKINNSFIYGESGKILKEIPSNSIDLIYADPPFYTQKIQYGSNKIKSHKLEKIKYSDKWGTLNDYLENLTNIISECHRILKNTGSIYLHCDDKALKYIWHIMDKIFEMGIFQNEIIWHYGLGGSSPKRYSRKHDTILFYSKSNKYTFTPPMVKATSQKMKGELKKADDVWDIPSINNMAKERLGYPTQKPEALLERIIKASSNFGDIVLDPFCGSGTTANIAYKLNRNVITMDFNLQSIAITQGRCDFLNMINITGEELIDYDNIINNIEKTRDIHPTDFEKLICKLEYARHLGGPNEPDGITFDRQTLIEVKHTEATIGTRAVSQMLGYLKKYDMKDGLIVGYSFSDDAKKSAKLNNIRLKRVYEYKKELNNVIEYIKETNKIKQVRFI